MLRLKIFALLKEAEKLLVSVTAIVSIAVLLTVPFVTSAAASLPSGSLDISAVVGDGTAGTVTNGASATGAVLEQPNGVWVGSSGSIYVTDAQAATLDYIPATTGTHYGQSMTAGDIYVIAGDPSGTQPADGLSPTSIKFSSVNDVIVDGSGNIYMADANDDVIGFIPASNGTYYGQSMTAGDFYVVAGTVTATGSPTVNTLATSTDLNFPDAIALGSNGLYITGNDEEVNFVPFASGTYYGQSMTANYIYKLAGTAATAGNPTSGTAATSTDLNGPDGVAVDSNGDVYIGDRYASEINFIPVTSGTYYGTSMTAEDIYTLSSSVNNPAEVAVDSAGDVFIANMGANEIDLIPVASGTYYGQSMTADSLYVIAGDGTAGLSGNGSVSTSAELNSPTGIFVTSNGSFYIGDTSNHEVRVVAPPPTITSVASATFTYDTAGSFNITTTGVPANSISESGTLPTGLSLTNNGNDTATLSGTPSEAGTFDITITASDSNGSANQSFTLTVNQASQTISFTSTAPSETYGSTTSYTPTATATSTLSVTFTIDASSSSVCSISGGVVSFSSGGTCIIDANQAGNTDWAAAPQVQQSITVGETAQTISFTSAPPVNITAGGANYTPTATATSTLGVTFSIDSSSTAGTCSISGGVVSFSSGGTCIIDANQAGNTDYFAAPQVQQSITVGETAQTISFTSTAPSETYGSTTGYTPTATATSTLGVTFTIDASSTSGCSITSGTVSFSSAVPGTCIIDANQAGNGTYSAAPQVQQVITVAKEAQTISFTSTAPSETYGSTTGYTPTATATSALGVTFTIGITSSTVCSISGGVVSFSSGGTCIIDANQAGNADYSVAPQVQQLVTINKEPQTIVFTSSPSSTAVVGGAGYTPTATATSALGAAFTIDSTSTSGTCSITSGAVLFLKPGTCIIDANQAGNSDYLAAPQVQQSFGVVDGTSPGAPTDINATKGSDALNFTWSPPAENGGLAISSYLISLKNVTSNTASSALQDYTTSYDATSLIPGDVYQMSVSAVNSAGTSPTALSDNYVAVSLGASSGATWSGVATSPNQSITVGSAASGNSSISVTASGGTGSVSVTKYSGSPLPQLPDIPGSTFFSTSLSSQENFSNVTVEICGIPSGGSIGWWDQNTHVLETPTDVTSLGNGCYDVTVNSSTIPDVSELVDGIFMGVPADGAALFGSSGTSYSGTGGSGALASKVIVSKSVSLLGQGAKLGVTMECQGISTCAGNVTVFAVGRVKNRMKKVEAARGAFKLLAGKQRTVYYKTTKLGKSIFFYDLKHHIKIKPSQFIVTMIKSEADQVSFYYPHLNMAPRFLISKTKKKTLTLRVGCEAKFSCSEKVLLWQAVKVAGKEKFVLFAHGYSRLGSGQEKDITLYVTKSGMTAMSLIRKEKEKKTTLILGLVGSIRIHEGALLIFR